MFTICAALGSLRLSQRLTRRVLAEMCDCNERTVARDLNTLRACGVAIEYSKQRRTLFLAEPLPFCALKLSMGETLALVAALEALRSREQTPWSRHAHEIAERLQELLPPALRSLLEERSTLSLDGRARRRYAHAPWRVLEDAIQHRQTLRMRYHTKSRGQTSTRLFDPYQIVERGGYYNAVGWCHTRGEVRLFALDSIRALEPTGKHFAPPDFDLQSYLHGSIGVLRGEMTRVAVRFHPPLSRWAREHHWPFPHEIAEETDDRVLVVGQVSGTEEIKTELLKWGASAEVLEPPALREALRNEAKAILMRYDSEKT